MRGATLVRELRSAALIISIHAPHARGDSTLADRVHDVQISIHAPHARGDADWRQRRTSNVSISIHAPHARGDGVEAEGSGPGLISIHAPHARGDRDPSNITIKQARFQSTPLMRGATSQRHPASSLT